MVTWRNAVVLVIICLGFFSHTVGAHQTADVIGTESKVYESPSQQAKFMMSLNPGEKVFISSKMVQDEEGVFWYKIKISSGGYGYIQANDVIPRSLQRELRQSGLAQADRTPSSSASVSELNPTPWDFLLRAMALGGVNTLHQLSYGGEGEATFCLPLRGHGYLHRLFSIGAAYFLFPNTQDRVLTGSLVLRFYKESVVEPELRIRFGQSLAKHFWEGGVSLGINYPFSLYYGTHISGYMEVGSLTAVASGYTTVLWGAAGLGLHF